MNARHNLTGWAALMALALAFPSCKKDTVHNNTGLNLKVRAVNSQYNIPVQTGTGNVSPTLPIVHWDTALLVVSEIRFEAELREHAGHHGHEGDQGNEGDSHEVEFSWNGPALVNLFNLNATIGNIPIPPGQYEGIKFSIVSRASDAGNKPVFYLSGTYTPPSGTPVPLIISITNDLMIKAEKEDTTITADSTTSINGIIQVYLARLFTSVVPENIYPSAVHDGKIIISATSNPSLYEMILENLGEDGDCEFEHGD